MLRVPRVMTASILVLTLIGVASCDRGPETLRILTDKKEMAPVIEEFDASMEHLTVTMSYVESIDAAVVASEDPDLVIGAYLTSSDLIDRWSGFDAMASTYPALDGPRDKKNQPLLTPLSFSLPLIMGEKRTMETIPDHATVRPEELREAAASFTTYGNDGTLIRMGFSPEWDPMTFVNLLAIRYPEALELGIENLDEERLNAVVQEARSWVTEAAGSPGADAAFNERYRYIPDEQLILEGRIGFALTDFESLAGLPDAISSRLGFRYLMGPRQIPVLSVTSAGIPKRSANSEAAEDFIEWIVRPEVQKALVDRWERDGIDVFGFLGGLSAVPTVNDTVVIDRFPSMEGMIPENHYLAVPSEVPYRWSRIQTEVVAPWFKDAAYSSDTVISLADLYRKWDLSSLDEAK